MTAVQFPVTLGEPRAKKPPGKDQPPLPGQQSRAEEIARRKNKVLQRKLHVELDEVERDQ